MVIIHTLEHELVHWPMQAEEQGIPRPANSLIKTPKLSVEIIQLTDLFLPFLRSECKHFTFVSIIFVFRLADIWLGEIGSLSLIIRLS